MSGVRELRLSDTISPGDFVRFGTELYEMVNPRHPTRGEGHVEIRELRRGHDPDRDRYFDSFDYTVTSFNRDFTEVYNTSKRRELALLSSLLIQATKLGNIEEVHELLLRVEV